MSASATDLFSQRPAASAQRQVAAPLIVQVSAVYECDCGRVHVIRNIEHYGRYILSCGKHVWPLQPKRNGPLVLYPCPDLLPGQRFTIEKEKE